MCGAARDVRFGPIADFLQISLENKKNPALFAGASGISIAEGSTVEYAPEKLSKSPAGTSRALFTITLLA
jgi:hypothetical protein